MKRFGLARKVVSIGGAFALMLLLDTLVRSRALGPTVKRMLAAMKRRPTSDAKLEAQVRAKLERTAAHPDLVRVTVEHACVELRGPIGTHERARVVRAISRVNGVDSIVDLLTEPDRRLVTSLLW